MSLKIFRNLSYKQYHDRLRDGGLCSADTFIIERATTPPKFQFSEGLRSSVFGVATITILASCCMLMATLVLLTSDSSLKAIGLHVANPAPAAMPAMAQVEIISLPTYQAVAAEAVWICEDGQFVTNPEDGINCQKMAVEEPSKGSRNKFFTPTQSR